MRILYAFPEPLPLQRARAGQVINAVHALALAGVDVDLAYVPAADRREPFQAYGLQRPENTHLHALSRGLPGPLSLLGVESNKLFLKRLYHLLGKPFSSVSPEVMMVRHLKIGAGLLQRFPDIPLVYEAHQVFADTASQGRRPRIRELEAMVIDSASLVIANSRGTADRLRESYAPHRVEVLPNGVRLPEDLPPKPWDRAAENVIYSGSLFSWKGVDDLIAAAGQLPGFRISIVGGSPDQIGALRKKLSSTGARVEFFGHLPQPEALKHLQHACIAVLPNRPEPDSAFTSPLKLFEYMAAGCAIIATDLPVFREILGEQDAVWVPPEDQNSLAEGIRTLARDPQTARHMGERLRVMAGNHTWRSRAEKMKTLLQQAARARPVGI